MHVCRNCIQQRRGSVRHCAFVAEVVDFSENRQNVPQKKSVLKNEHTTLDATRECAISSDLKALKHASVGKKTLTQRDCKTRRWYRGTRRAALFPCLTTVALDSCRSHTTTREPALHRHPKQTQDLRSPRRLLQVSLRTTAGTVRLCRIYRTLSSRLDVVSRECLCVLTAHSCFSFSR